MSLVGGKARLTNKKPTVKGRAIASIIGLCFVLVVGEVGARIFYTPVHLEIRGFDLRASNYYRKDDELGWVPNKNVRGTHDKPGSFSTTFRTNSNGFRDKEYDLHKPEGVTRIVAVGDSHTWGFGVDDHEVYSEVLESLLPNTEVINLGVTGYSLNQEIKYFAREGTKYKPDILLLGFTLNDIYRPELDDKNAKTATAPATETRAPKKEKEPFFRSIKKALDKTYLYKFFIDRINTNKSVVRLFTKLGLKEPPAGFEGLDNNLMPALITYPDVLSKSFEVTKSELLELKKLASERGTRLIIVVIPALQSVDPLALRHSIAYTRFDTTDFDLDKPYKLLGEFANDANIELIYFTNSFRQAHDEGRQLYLIRDIHLTSFGHDLLAREIARYLFTSEPPF